MITLKTLRQSKYWNHIPASWHDVFLGGALPKSVRLLGGDYPYISLNFDDGRAPVRFSHGVMIDTDHAHGERIWTAVVNAKRLLGGCVTDLVGEVMDAIA